MTAIYDGPRIEPWMQYAACIGKPAHWWFPDNQEQWHVQGRAAINVCRTCPVASQCLDFALATDERYGIYGGLRPTEREELKRKQRTTTLRKVTP
jgi:WhiB family transcriptional regulator, redox-sensing transcriptional regulator